VSDGKSGAGLRSDSRFSEEMTDADVARVLAHEPFRSIDANGFPAKLRLEDILHNDTRILRLRPGDVVVREGDYGNSAFAILSGKVRVIKRPKLPPEALGRPERRRRGVFAAIAQLWTNPHLPEVRESRERPGGQQTAIRGRDREGARMFLTDPEEVIRTHDTDVMSEGMLFGEVGALSRSPRTATIFAETDVELVEIRWQGLRDIRRWDAGFRERIDTNFRKYALRAQLRECALFRNLSDERLAAIERLAMFESYGEFDWFGAQKVTVLTKDHAARLQEEPVIASEDEVADSLIIIRSGFARLSEQVDHGHRTVDYLRPGETFGLGEIVYGHQTNETINYQRSLRAVGYVDVLRVPASIIEEQVLPVLSAEDMPPPLKPRGPLRSAWRHQQSDREIESGMLEFLVEHRFINGRATMLIDVDRCTRCDECVRACAVTHDNNPRFVRHGPSYGHHTIANACMHCADPVCLIGCPTGAIHRDVTDGMVVINDDTCIGCGTCAASCPYDNIRLVEIRDRDGRFVLDETGAQVLKATKCDLCVNQPSGPACQRACPHEALVRIDMRDREAVAAWINRG